MAPYIVVFIINLILALIADYFYTKRRLITIVCVITISVVDTVFVGLRDFGVGYDTNVYIDFYFNRASTVYSITSFLQIEDTDKGFLFLAWIARFFSNDSQSLLVLTELFIITFTLLGIILFKRALNLKISTYIVFYWLILFFFSENFMRQYCAMSLVFFGYSLLLNGFKFTYIGTQILAFFFHKSSIVFVFVPFFFFLSKLESKRRQWITIVAIVLFAISIIFYYYLLALLGNYEVISELYVDRYSNDGTGVNNKGWSVGILYIVSVIIQYIIYRQTKIMWNLSEDIQYMNFILFVVTVLFSQMNAYNLNLNRIALYVHQIYLIYFTLIFSSKYVNILLKSILLLILLRFCIRASFNYDYEPQNYTYSSKILNIN